MLLDSLDAVLREVQACLSEFACYFIFTASTGTLKTFVFVVNCLSKWRVLLRLENYSFKLLLTKR